MSCTARGRHPVKGFTLAEMAVTIVIVGVGLTLVLQGLNASQLTAAYTRNMRLARELALQTMGEISSGLWWDSLTPGGPGTYSVNYDDNPGFEGEFVLGEESFPEDGLEEEALNTWAERDRLREQAEASARAESGEEEEEEITEPYEKVRLRVSFPKIQELPHFFELERWIPWEQVYGPSEADEESSEAEGDAGSGGGGP